MFTLYGHCGPVTAHCTYPQTQTTQPKIPPKSNPSMESPQSPLRLGESPSELPSPPAEAIVVRAGAAARAGPPAVTKAEEGSGAVTWIPQRDRAAAAARRAGISARIAAAALCLVSFAVMAADKNKGWALDSFGRYKEYRYCLTVNVIGFVYSGFQGCAEVHHLISKRYILSRPMGFFFDFAMDQILAYLLISASSSATARNDYWVWNWGNDPFPSMINGSVAVSFLAFVAFAVSSIISAYNLFTSKNL